MKILFLVFLMGCTSLNRTESPKESMTDRQRLQEVYDANLASFDFGEPRDCDTALWAGVARCGGSDVDLSEYLFPGDKPQRRTRQTCYQEDPPIRDSRSTASNDSVIGLSMCAPEIGARILSYAKANNGFLGEPRSAVGEVVLKPNVQVVLEASDTPTIYSKPKEDYQYHIQVLLILWESRTYGKISKNALSRLEGAVEAYPRDYLFQAALGVFRGNMDEATKLLLEGVNPSSYVRGGKEFPMANWLMAARLVLDN